MADRRGFLLRLSPELMEEMTRWAKDDLRSVNAQIEYLLREAVRRRRRELPPPLLSGDAPSTGPPPASG